MYIFLTGRYPLAATRRRGYRGQRSVSMDDASPSDSEHEKWEREAHQENIWHGQGQKSGQGKGTNPILNPWEFSNK